MPAADAIVAIIVESLYHTPLSVTIITSKARFLLAFIANNLGKKVIIIQILLIYSSR